MSDAPPEEPAGPQPTLAHRLEFAAFRSLEWLLQGTSMGACVATGRILGGAFFGLSGRYRRLVRRNLRIATADAPLPRRRLDSLVRETFRRAGANFLASLKTATLEEDEIDPFIEHHGFREVFSRLGPEEGLIVVMPHMGNWEALTQIGNRLVPGRAYGGVYRPLANPLMDELTRRHRTAGGGRLFSRKDGFHAPASFLKQGGVLAVLADQRAGGRGAVLPFFGKLASCSPLPQLLARRGKARLASLAIITRSAERWELALSPIEGTEAASTDAIMRALESTIRLSLPDLFWFHDRWRVDNARPLSFFTRIDPEQARRARVPLRLLLSARTGELDALRALVDALLAERPDLRIDLVIDDEPGFDDARVVVHPLDPTTPPEQVPAVFARVDAAHPAPLDAALLLDNSPVLARCARRAGVRAIIGLADDAGAAPGKPFSRCYPRPGSRGGAADLAGWASLAEQLAHVPDSTRPRRT